MPWKILNWIFVAGASAQLRGWICRSLPLLVPPRGPAHLAGPLWTAFGHVHRLEFYTPAAEQIIQRAASILNAEIKSKASAQLESGRLTPRIANRLLKRVQDYADVNGDGLDTEIANRRCSC